MHCSCALTDHAAAPGLQSAIVPRPLIATIAAMRCLEHTINVITDISARSLIFIHVTGISSARTLTVSTCSL
jgi:hypothetical protein